MPPPLATQLTSRLLRALPCRSNARLDAPRTSTPSSVTFTAFVIATPLATLSTATLRSTTLDAPVWKSNPSGRAAADRKRLPPAARFVLPAMTTRFVAAPEKALVSRTVFVAV